MSASKLDFVRQLEKKLSESEKNNFQNYLFGWFIPQHSTKEIQEAFDSFVELNKLKRQKSKVLVY